MEGASACAPVCRICYESDTAEGDVFLAPCLCNGSLKYVHRSCLDQWRLRDYNPTSRTHCETCGGPYNLNDTSDNDEIDDAGDGDLREGWKTVFDGGGNKYYWYETTGEVQWDKPVRTLADGDEADDAGDGDLREGWETAFDAAGIRYYWNAITRSVQWDKPRRTTATGGGDRNDAGDGHLREGWKTVFDGGGNKYYWYETTGEVQWDKPVRTLADGDEADDAGDGDLREDWKTAFDAAGRRYYWNAITRSVQWDKPRRTTATGGAPPREAAREQEPWFLIGQYVRIIGMEQAPQLNGRLGKIVEHHHRTGLYGVQFFRGQVFRISPANLEFEDYVEVD